MSQRPSPAPNAIVHFDITGPREQELHQFYGGLLGWKVQPQGPGYALVETPGGLRGAIADADQGTVTLGVAVPDLTAALRHAEELGGSVIMPPTDNGWVVKAQVKDPAGNPLTLIQSRRSETAEH
jgi:predicted enzyme related to lactoylglutathione lyase